MKLPPSFCQLAFRPTAAGGFWLLAVIALLATAINYGNNLIFALAFLLLALWLQAAWQCRRNLAGIVWQAFPTTAVFAGESLSVEGRLSESFGRVRHEIALSARAVEGLPVIVPADSESVASLPWLTVRRGEQAITELALLSRYPLGLWQSRRPLPALTALAYPHLAGSAPLPAVFPQPAHRQAAADDFQGLRAYALGDPPRRINWRAYSRREELLVNQFDGGPGGDVLWLSWAESPGSGEARLSQLARWVMEAEHAGHDYGLQLPGKRWVPARGRAHREQCLKTLALFKAETGSVLP